MRMPTSKPNPAKFRGPTSSEAFNRSEDDKYLELVELYRQSNLNLQNLTEAHQIILAENGSLHGYISMLEQRITSLSAQMDRIEAASPYDPIFFKTGYTEDMRTVYPNLAQENGESGLRCDIDAAYRHATVPLIQRLPKTHTVNEKNGQVVVPSELRINLGRTNTKGEVVDNDVYNAFNGQNESFWQRTVTYSLNDCPAEEDVIVEIELPSHLVNNLNVNTIEINPHPERGVEIRNIEIHYNSAWQTIAGFNQPDLSAVNSNRYAPRKKWYFPNVPVQKVRITLVQKNAFDIAGKKVFALGAQEIGVALTQFEPAGGTVLIPFEMDGIYNIESVDHVFLNRDTFGIDRSLDHLMEGRVFDYEILREEADGFLTPLRNNEWSGQYANKLWVRTKLYLYNGVNPCLHAVRLNYSL